MKNAQKSMSPVYTPIKNWIFCFFFLVELGSHRNHICDETKLETLLISNKICGFQNVRKYRLQIVTFDRQQPISSMFVKKKNLKISQFLLKCSQNINKLYSFLYCQKKSWKSFWKTLLKPISPLKEWISHMSPLCKNSVNTFIIERRTRHTQEALKNDLGLSTRRYLCSKTYC